MEGSITLTICCYCRRGRVGLEGWGAELGYGNSGGKKLKGDVLKDIAVSFHKGTCFEERHHHQ